MQVQQKQDDMQFEKMRRFTLEMVCAVYGVPKDILGLTETSNRSV
jgi:phage portal protein BeeE